MEPKNRNKYEDIFDSYKSTAPTFFMDIDQDELKEKRRKLVAWEHDLEDWEKELNEREARLEMDLELWKKELDEIRSKIKPKEIEVVKPLDPNRKTLRGMILGI